MITAALPTFNNSKIIWIQLSALCDQVGAGDWELIVCEEPSDNTLGVEGLREWVDKLKKAGCKRIVYLSLDKWIPLGQKWIEIRERMHPDSIGMMLCASDNYSPNDRIANSRLAMESGADWYQCQSGYFYNIVAHQAGKFQAVDDQPALFMCASKTSLGRVIENTFPTRGVDTWLKTVTKPEQFQLDDWTDGIHTDGFNTISLNRRLLYAEADSGHFKQADAAEVLGQFPTHIREKLAEWQQF